MPNALATVPAPLQTAQPPGRGGPAPVMVPFVRAARQQVIPTELDRQVQLSASSQQIATFEIPAQGWLRHVDILVEATAGVAGTAFVADGPYSVIDSVQITDPAGNPIAGPVSGYELYLLNKYGGYEFEGNPTTKPSYSAAVPQFSFYLRVPVEASERDAYGALPNQDSSAAYRVTLVCSGSASVYTTTPTTQPLIRFRAWAEVWSQPTATDLAGNMQAQNPPGPGTTQFWTREIQSTVAGMNTLRVRRVGNLVRTLIVIGRDATGARITDAQLPDPVRWLWDSLVLTDEARILRKSFIYEQYGYTTLDTGVYIFNFSHDLDGHPGFELRNGLLPTTKATRLELQGNFGVAGSCTFLINDIQPVGLP